MAARKNPGGGKGQDKIWSDAVGRAVAELRVASEGKKGKKIKALFLLARKLVDRALDGDIAALKEIGDRMDGKPAQAVQHTGKDGGPISTKDETEQPMSERELGRRIMFALERAARAPKPRKGT